MKYRSWLIGALLALSILMVVPASAQDRTVYWNVWDVTINNVDPAENRFTVTEDYDLDFTGTFRFGQRVVEETNVSDIVNVRVSQAGSPLRESCSQQPGTYCVNASRGETSITYYFNAPIANGSSSFQLQYDVLGAIRIYEGGDQIWWTAIPSEHFGFPVGSSTVTVELPPNLAPREGVDPIVTYGAPTNVTVNGSTARAAATREIGGYESLEIRAQFPHSPDAATPAWQQSFDQRRDFEQNVQPLINLFALVVSLALAIGGPLLVYTRYQKAGRDPEVGPVPEYLTDPPSELPPALVGTLIDERADVRDVMSTIFDLGRRGYLVIEEEQNEGFLGIGRSSEFTFKRTDKSDADLRPFEQRVMDNIFSGGRMERSLDSMRNKFYTVVSQVQNDLYQELVAEGLFDKAPNVTRNNWGIGGVALIVLAGIGFFFLSASASRLSPMLMCIPLALGVTAVAVIIAGQQMPAKTRKGAEEAARWNAFMEYLRNLEKYSDVQDASVHFQDYLPYSVAFGLDKSWMSKFSRVEAMPIPPWYYPTYMGGPYGRGYIPGTPIYGGGGMSGMPGPGDLARAGGGGFNMETLSQGMASSMENLSAGLSSMMESATRAMTSRPQSASSGSSGSWGGGGGSFSGGGGGGGGSSGGGSSGFG